MPPHGPDEGIVIATPGPAPEASGSAAETAGPAPGPHPVDPEPERAGPVEDNQEGRASLTGLAAAQQFQSEFVPTPGVDYGWVLERAKGYYAAVEAAVDQLDAKALGVVNYFGAGAGVLAFVAAAGAATGGASAVVVGLAVPSFAAAVGSLVYAMLARAPGEFQVGAPTAWCARSVDRYRGWAVEDGAAESDASKRAEYASAGAWELAAETNAVVMERKARMLASAVRWKVAAVTLLVLPLVAAVVEKAVKRPEPPKPLDVRIWAAPPSAP